MTDVRVFSIPMRTRFRGITVREGMLIRGEAGWGELSPFLEYDADEAAAWLRCAEEAAAGDWPEPVRDRVPVNVTVPCSPPRTPTRSWPGRAAGPPRSRSPSPGTLAEDQARLEAVRDALGPGGRIRVDANVWAQSVKPNVVVPPSLLAGIANLAGHFAANTAAEQALIYGHLGTGAFRDIKNATSKCGVGNTLHALTGYDTCTGVGSPQGRTGL